MHRGGCLRTQHLSEGLSIETHLPNTRCASFVARDYKQGGECTITTINMQSDSIQVILQSLQHLFSTVLG